MTYDAQASYTIDNSWCAVEDLTFSWTYKYMDLPWSDVSLFLGEVVDYQTPIAVNQTAGDIWEEPVSDYQIDMLWEVEYSSTNFDSQNSFTVNATDYFEYTQICRPKFSYDLVIQDLSLASNETISLSVKMETNTSGLQNCGDMTALVEVFIESTDELVYS